MAKTQPTNAFKSLLQTSGQVPAQTGQGIKAAETMEKETGRRNRPGFTQVAAYVPAALYKQVKVKLLQEPTQRNFSELIEALLIDYLGK